MTVNGLRNSSVASSSWCSARSGIDWLSCSAPRGDDGDALYAQGVSILNMEVNAGNQKKPWKLKALTGAIAGSTVLALSGTHVYVQVSSERAREYAPSIIPLARNVSRLDLQVTAERHEQAPLDLARIAYKASGARRRGGRPVGRSLYQTTAGGATCYLGSRRSDVFGRVYDKGVEQETHQPGRLWRWELELKRDVAELTARELVLVESLEEAVAGYVSHAFGEWGVPCPPSASSLPMHRPPQQSTDADRLLRWLAVGVAPSVGYLRGIGRLSEVLKALGLDSAPTDSSS